MVAEIFLVGAIGVFLGSNFKIFILGPAIFVASSVTVAASIVSGLDFIAIICAALAILTALEIGYVVGGIAAVSLSTPRKLSHSDWRTSRHY
jgi:hypothetical protein